MNTKPASRYNQVMARKRNAAAKRKAQILPDTESYVIETDNMGRRVIREDGYNYYLALNGCLMREGFRQTQTRDGKVWQTPERRKVGHIRIQVALENDIEGMLP